MTTLTTDTTAISTEEPCTLIPINLHNSTEFAELKHQRQKCGWDYEDTNLLAWRDKQDANLKSFFWITIPSSTESDARRTRAGHISLDSYANPPDPELAMADRSVLTIQTFFILPEYRGGLGRRAMDLVEVLAAEEPYGSPQCKYLTLNTISKRYFYEESGFWNKLDRVRPQVCTAEWYERRGYVCWKSESRYREPRLEGDEAIVYSDLMRKPLLR
ncbi:hypothetical protein BDV28DRAFT_159000 [Aspergillus coremiiformis]|uniref:N-acetyltransferase domain-containing protein n=1 Tax=Aspergillus coremiiformis TaxID=138285 RepID=A0A5N6Z2F3_9EURO|nr:hypothetical protein BDV28DRAFT_159000 [Aspergillus coremiiformis]